MTSGLTTGQQNAVKTFMNALATAGLDAKCEFAHILALPGSNWSLNLKGTSATATNHGATHTDLLGIVGDGTAGYVDTGCSPATALTVAGVNDHSYFYAQTNMDYDNAPQLCIDANFGNFLSSLDFGSNFSTFLASIGGTRWSNPDTTGSVAYFGASRTSSTAVQLYHNGIQVASSTTDTSTGEFEPGNIFYLGGPNTGLSVATLGFGSMFSGLTSAEHAILFGAVRTVLHALNPAAYP